MKLVRINANGTKSEYAGKETSAGAGDAGEFPVLNSAGKLDSSLLPNGVGADSIALNAGENLAAGDFVYVNASGDVMKADGSAVGKQAIGYVLSAVTSGNSATVFFDDSNSGLSGLTPGSVYYLSHTTPGAVYDDPSGSDGTSGAIVQRLGVAINSTTIHVNIQEPIIR